ncbi:MAG: hypothetical protein ABF876_09670 [Acetobacter aceti]|uniref:Uncharacterized protein n=1 Tax=Acetobacter aceti TaxID=435 RepID=A0A1U9KH32_ACEAC|nr:hypothetical protein [Acetobacter aceti]AQS85113.1 hypothetical protein A0U92_10345 [Acetobacter aceti]
MASLVTSLITENPSKMVKVTSGKLNVAATPPTVRQSSSQSPSTDLSGSDSSSTFSDHIAQQTASQTDNSQFAPQVAKTTEASRSSTGQANSAQSQNANVASLLSEQNEATLVPTSPAAILDGKALLSAAQDSVRQQAKTATADETATIAASAATLSTSPTNSPTTATATGATTSDSPSAKSVRVEKLSQSSDSADEKDADSTTTSPSDITLELAALSVLQPLSAASSVETAVKSTDSVDEVSSIQTTTQGAGASSASSSVADSGKATTTARTLSGSLPETNALASAPSSEENISAIAPALFKPVVDSTSSDQQTSLQAIASNESSPQATDSSTALTAPADIKIDTSSTALSHDDARPVASTSFSQLQSLQDIASPHNDAAGITQFSLSATPSPSNTVSDPGTVSSASLLQTASAQQAALSTQSPVIAASAPTPASNDSTQAQLQTAPSSAQVQIAQSSSTVATSFSTGRVTASRASRVDNLSSSRPDVPDATSTQTVATKPQADEISSPVVSEKTLSDKRNNGSANQSPDQRTSSDQSLTASLLPSQTYNESNPFSEPLAAGTSIDTSPATSASSQTSTTSATATDASASSHAGSTALNLTVALQNDDQTPLHVTIDKSDNSDGLNIHIGADGLTTLNELQNHKHELVHALENAGISTAESQISFGLANNSSDSSFSQNNHSYHTPQDNSTNATAGSSDFANAFSGTLSGNSNGDGSRNAWNANPSAAMTSASASASDTDDTSDQTYALAALRTGSVNITA